LVYPENLARLLAGEGVQGVRSVLTFGLALFVALGLGGSALVSNRYWRKAVSYARTGRVSKRQKA
jgi:hypothetical protein